MKCRIWLCADDKVMTTSYGNPPISDDLMEKTGIEIRAKGYDWLDFEDVDDSTLPDKKYFDAWRKKKGKGITIDVAVKAETDARPTKEEEELIQAKLRAMAIEKLKQIPEEEGGLPLDFVDGG